jgi:hypothetical protein
MALLFPVQESFVFAATVSSLLLYVDHRLHQRV